MCAGPCCDVRGLSHQLSETLVLSSPLPNFRLVLPVQHMTLSLCCLTKHWLCLSTHSQAGSTNEIRAMPKRKVALNIKTEKQSQSRTDSL